MDRLDKLEQNHPEAGTETFPETWTDPMELYGSYRKELEGKLMNLDKEREALVELMERDSRYTPEYVWKSRGHLVSQRIFINEF